MIYIDADSTELADKTHAQIVDGFAKVLDETAMQGKGFMVIVRPPKEVT